LASEDCFSTREIRRSGERYIPRRIFSTWSYWTCCSGGGSGNGNIVSTEKIYPIRLIELELKAHDERYRDKKELDVKVSGGVLVAPADVSSIDDWEARFGEGKVIEGEAQEGSDD